MNKRWRLVVKMGSKSEVGGMVRWILEAYPPGGGRMVSSFETGRKCGRVDFAVRLLGKVEDLLGKVAPGGIERELEEAGKR